MKYLIIYDLHAPEQNYDQLIATIKLLPAWKHVCGSCWSVKTESPCSQVRDCLLPYIDPNDRLLVVPFSSFCSRNLPDDIYDFLSR